MSLLTKRFLDVNLCVFLSGRLKKLIYLDYDGSKKQRSPLLYSEKESSCVTHDENFELITLNSKKNKTWDFHFEKPVWKYPHDSISYIESVSFAKIRFFKLGFSIPIIDYVVKNKFNVKTMTINHIHNMKKPSYMYMRKKEIRICINTKSISLGGIEFWPNMFLLFYKEKRFFGSRYNNFFPLLDFGDILNFYYEYEMLIYSLNEKNPDIKMRPNVLATVCNRDSGIPNIKILFKGAFPSFIEQTKNIYENDLAWYDYEN